MSTATQNDIVDGKQLSELLGVSVVTIGRWRREGRIPSTHLSPRCVRFSRRAVFEKLGLNTASGEE